MAGKSKGDVETTRTNTETLMLGYLCVKDIDNLIEQVNILDRFGLEDADIAAICNYAIQSVRNARQKAKRRE
jgi:hypothetical protein